MDTLNKLQWRNLNSNRNYPFTDASLLYFDDAFLPQSWIVDARIYARGNYSAPQSCYVSKLIRTAEGVALQVSAYDGVLLGEAKISFESAADLIPIMDAEVPAGCLVIDPARNSLLQAISEGEYELDSNVAQFVPSACEYLPASQVQSINDKSGTVTLTGNEGIQVIKVDASTIQINIVGDPHFNRYGCIQGQDDAANDALDLSATFLKKLSVLHYVKTPNGSLSGPFVSRLVKKDDGSIVLALKTRSFNSADETVELRPAFRITTEGNTITFSMAGAG